jgi:hypothetical protein
MSEETHRQLNAVNDLVAASVLVPVLSALLNSIERIPLTMKTHPTQEEARAQCCKLLTHLKWITREVKADKLRREWARGMQMELRLR